jgi:hAT family C-terminal dimerisation region
MKLRAHDRFDPIIWWSQPDRRSLPYPATSCECERDFSSIKKLITPERNTLGDNIIEALECLRAWWNCYGFTHLNRWPPFAGGLAAGLAGAQSFLYIAGRPSFFSFIVLVYLHPNDTLLAGR